jgi:hypothetical protein
MPHKTKRLEVANFDRALAAVQWEAADAAAEATGRASDRREAGQRDRALDAADRKIKTIEKEK